MAHKHRFVMQSLALTAVSIAIAFNVQPANAATFNFTDGNSSAIFDSDVGFTNWTVDGVNQVFQISNFIRVTGDAQEFLVQPDPLSFTLNGLNGGTIVYSDPSFNYTISLDFLLTGGVANSGVSTLSQTVTFGNSSGGPLSLSLFNYNDLDVAGDFPNDTLTIAPGTFLATQTDGTTQLIITPDVIPSLTEVGTDLASSLINSLVDSNITNLNGSLTSGAPLADGRNFAYQFDVSNLANNGSFGVTQTFSAVPFEFSPTLGLLALGVVFGANHLRKRLLK